SAPEPPDKASRKVSMSGASLLYVQYGCGACAPPKWINFDASPRLRLERIPVLRTLIRATSKELFAPHARAGDIVAGLPLPDRCAAAVYCSHVLEHLPRAELETALRNTYRLLTPGGRFRLIVPDLHWRAKEYVEAASRDDVGAADRFMEISF